MNKLQDLNLDTKRVFLRADLNVPLTNSKILCDHKLDALGPTLDFLHEKKCKIVLATHIGRPAHNNDYSFDETLSTTHLIPWFKQAGYTIELEADLTKAQSKSCEKQNTILLLENLRFFKGEQNQDEAFAHKLSKLGDVYINDAFGAIHRKDTSIMLLPQLYKPENKGIGLLIEKELHELSGLIENPAQPFVLVLGGKKIEDKIPLITSFIKRGKEIRPTTIIIAGALAYTFLKAQGEPVGLSLVEDSLLETVKMIMKDAQKNNVEIVLPIDHKIQNDTSKSVVTIPNDGKAVDIGKGSVELFSRYTKDAQTIFVNGTMGIHSDEITQHGTRKVFKDICDSNAYTVVGGGDATAALYKHGLEKKVDFISTGGGATLTCLGLEQQEILKLPALKAL